MSTPEHLMASFRKGDKDAVKQLIEVFYPELRRLAARKMKGERSTHTWQPTTLISELYLELLKVRNLSPGPLDEDDKAAFLGLAAHLMKRLLIHYARPLRSRVQKVELTDDLPNTAAHPGELQEIDDLLERLGAIHPRLRSVVEMRVFEGCTTEQMAKNLGCSEVTVARSWRFAKTWLQDQLKTARSD